MKTRTFLLLERAIQYATFQDHDTETNFKKLLKVSDVDLDEAGFEESAVAEDICDVLKEAIDEFEAAQSTDDKDEESEELDPDELPEEEDEKDEDDNYDPLVDLDKQDEEDEDSEA